MIEEVIMMLTIEEIKERVRPICEHYKIKRMWLFGSYARGEADEKSDVDLCIEGGDFMNEPWGLGGISCMLEDSLQMPFDLVQREVLRKRFLQNIQDDEVLIYER